MKAHLLSAAALLALSGCDNGGVIDQTIQGGVRHSAVQACIAYVPQSEMATAAGLDPQRLCACAVDRMLEVRNVADLAQLRPDSPEGRAAIAQCIAENRSTPTPAAPT